VLFEDRVHAFVSVRAKSNSSVHRNLISLLSSPLDTGLGGWSFTKKHFSCNKRESSSEFCFRRRNSGFVVVKRGGAADTNTARAETRIARPKSFTSSRKNVARLRKKTARLVDRPDVQPETADSLS
jgi:hypothetical protein